MKAKAIRLRKRALKTSVGRYASFNSAAVKGRTSTQWMQMRDRHILSVFRAAASQVPAYAKFLKREKCAPSEICSVRDIVRIPKTSKNSYLRVYPLSDLFARHALHEPHVWTSTSGSTGEPFYFSRATNVDEQSSLIHELFFRTSSLNPNTPTLVIVCFGMGIWIGGIITYQAFSSMARRGYAVSIITPGINKVEILKALRNLVPYYPQVILAGYPPFIKDVLDEAEAEGIRLPRRRVGIVTAAEAYTEHFRDYLARKAHVANPLTDIMNIYGTAEIGTMAFETPIAILARRLAGKHEKLFAEVFGDITKTPTLAQFIPGFVSFESKDGELFLTGDSAMPLVRYALGDHGDVFSFDELVSRFKKHGIDLMKEAHKAGIERCVLKLPFVYVYERKDLATTLYGLQIYPETVREALLSKSLAKYVTGRMALATKYDEKHNQYLEINIELRKGVSGSHMLSANIQSEVVKLLKHKNAEYRELANYLGKRAMPHVVFWPHEDPLYFRPDIKQRWVIKTPSVRYNVTNET